MADNQNDYSPAGIAADIERTVRDQESMRDWWERAHVRDHQVWLTGSHGEEVWQRLEMLDRIKRGAAVLNIGVGRGLCTRGLSSRGCVVDVLDISESALDKVRDVTRSQYLASALWKLPSSAYDAALSHLVAQHMMDDDLRAQIKDVVRSLKPNGVFAIQFATSMNPTPPTQDPTSAKGGSVQRTPARVTELAVQAGGTVVLSKEKEQFPDHQAGWHVVHIMKA